ncbi:unnamed protein product [Trichobilharzia szidati]|nr:unnamed protein product [Trichobilharzia szidati]
MHVFFVLLFVSIFETAFSQTHLEVGGIKAVRLAAGTSVYPEKRDGVLEVNYNGTWGTICNIGFDELAASVACFMLGYPPRGVPIMNSQRQSPSSAPLLSEFNCTGRVVLPSSSPSTATVHLGVCAFSNELPSACKTTNRQTSIVCLDPAEMTTTTTPVPNYMTLAPVNCSFPAYSSIRLVDGTSNAGRVEVKHPETNVWGTICADGFDVNAARALCRMLCTSSDNLQYAYPVLYQYGSAPDSTPIHLSRLQCPPDAQNLNDCHLGGGWGNAPGCTHGMDIGLQCGPRANVEYQDIYRPQFTCNQTTATVMYDRSLNHDLNSSMVLLDEKPVPADCQYHVEENTTHVTAFVPLVGCGGSITLSNRTSLAIKLNLMRIYLTPDNGIISNLPVKFTVTCLIPRSNQIHSEAFASPNITSSLLSRSEGISSLLKLYRDQLFTVQLNQPITIPPGERVHALVSLVNPQKTSKLILEDCWATATPNRNSTPRQDLIVNKCVAFQDLLVVPSSPTQVGFTFDAFYLNTAGTVVPIVSNLYLHCDTRVCDIRETSEHCQQFCRSPTILTSTTATTSTATTTTLITTLSNNSNSGSSTSDTVNNITTLRTTAQQGNDDSTSTSLLKRYKRDGSLVNPKIVQSHGRVNIESGEMTTVGQ